MKVLPEIRVGDPLSYQALSVFPLFTPTSETVSYLLADEGLSNGTVTVEEVGEAGSVPTLSVENKGDIAVLFIEGEELQGAKQNRVLNTSVLIAAGTKTTIPVSCVEQGRWRYQSRRFDSGGRNSSHKLRRILKKSVSRSTRAGQGHSSDQGEVWEEVQRQMDALGAQSNTMAMADTYNAHSSRMEDYRGQLGYVTNASGFAVAVGAKVVALDLFDKPTTCEKAWNRLMTGYVMDALEESGQDAGKAVSADVQKLVQRLQSAAWQQTPAVGLGDEFRADAPEETYGSALVVSGSLVHGSAMVAAE